MHLTIQLSDDASASLRRLWTVTTNCAEMHAAMAGATEIYLKKFGAETSQTKHRTAERLGATPTGHLADAYSEIESGSDGAAMRLFIPGASRLRAAFGSYTVTPGSGKKYLTIPVAAEAYGKRARQIDGLQFMVVGPNRTPILAKSSGDRLTTYYLLVKSAMIPADPSLIHFDVLAEEAVDAAEEYLEMEAAK